MPTGRDHGPACRSLIVDWASAERPTTRSVKRLRASSRFQVPGYRGASLSQNGQGYQGHQKGLCTGANPDLPKWTPAAAIFPARAVG